jgi:hypothetical protein
MHTHKDIFTHNGTHNEVHTPIMIPKNISTASRRKSMGRGILWVRITPTKCLRLWVSVIWVLVVVVDPFRCQ